MMTAGKGGRGSSGSGSKHTMEDVISKMAKVVIPSERAARSKARIAGQVLGLVREGIVNFDEIIGVELGGSYAKGTWLANDNADVDIFVRFTESTTTERLEEAIIELGYQSLSAYNPYVRYSQHPFTEAVIKGTRINVVSFYDVKPGRWKSAADRSPYHTRFMKGNLTPDMRNQVRILKRFLKSAGVYGAEIARQGFSGYAAEVLVLHFGSFENVVRSMSRIDRNAVIGEASKKFDTPIVITDPIDDQRNLAAAISGENLGRFILTCRAFAKRPTAAFFQKRPQKTLPDGLWAYVLGIRFGFEARSQDVIWGQIKRTAASLSRHLELGGFNVIRSAPYADQRDSKAYLFFLLESMRIPAMHIKGGPEFFKAGYTEKYISSNIKTSELMWIDDDLKIASLEMRKHTEAAAYMKDLLRREGVGGKAGTSISKGLRADLRHDFGVFIGGQGLDRSVKEAAGRLISTDDSFIRSG